MLRPCPTYIYITIFLLQKMSSIEQKKPCLGEKTGQLQKMSMIRLVIVTYI